MTEYTIPHPAPETTARALLSSGKTLGCAEAEEYARDLALLSAKFENALIKHRAQRRWLVFTGPTWRRLSRLVFGLIRFSFKSSLFIEFALRMKDQIIHEITENRDDWKTVAKGFERQLDRERQSSARREATMRDLRKRISHLSRALEKTQQPKLP